MVPVPGLMPFLVQVFIQPREVCDTLTWQGVFHPQRQLSCPWEPLSPSSPAVVQLKQHFMAKPGAWGCQQEEDGRLAKPLMFCCPFMPAWEARAVLTKAAEGSGAVQGTQHLWGTFMGIL